MPPQIVIVSSPAEAAPARELIRETGLNAEVLEAADETVVSEVQAAFGENAGVAVARGRLAALLKAQKAVPVVEAVLSAQDMADLLEKACLLAGRPPLSLLLIPSFITYLSLLTGETVHIPLQDLQGPS